MERRISTGTRQASPRQARASSPRTPATAVTSSLRRQPNISTPRRPVKYPSVKPLREKTARRVSMSKGLPSRAARQAAVAAATYSGRFIRPSIFR